MALASSLPRMSSILTRSCYVRNHCDAGGIWRNAEEVKAVDDYQVVFRMKSPTSIMPYAASRGGDLRIVSKAQWDKEGLEGFDKRPAGTGSYRYVNRQLGQSDHHSRRVENHWRGEKPDFKELEIRLARKIRHGWP